MEFTLRLKQKTGFQKAAFMNILQFANTFIVRENTNNRDEAIIESLIETYGTTIKRICLMYLRDPGYAEEAAQDVFVKAYFKINTLNDKRSQKAWLARIAINTCKDYLRKSIFKMQNYTYSLENLPIEPSAASEDIDLVEAILSLEKKYKDVIIMYYYHRMRVREIAEILHCSNATVWRRLSEAEELIRVCLED